MPEEYFEKTPRKANRWFLAFIVLALLYGITFSLYAIFNWIFFFTAAYSLFMSYFLLPVQPKIFQQRPKPFTTSNGGRASYNPSPSSSVVQADRVKKVVRIIMISVVSFFAFLIVVGIFSDNNDDQTTSTSNEEEQPYESNEPSEAETLTYKGNDFINNSQPDSADWYYDRALEVDSDFMMAVYGKGLVQYNKGYKDEANTYFARAYDGGYRYAWLSWVLADTYDKSGATTRAIELYKESVKLDSTFVDSYNRLAELVPAERDKYLELAQKHASN